MKTLRPRRLVVPLTIAALLAALTMGNISICDVVLLGVPGEADTLRVNVQAGETALNVRGNPYETYLFRLCPPGVVAGVYPVTHFFGSPEEGYRTVDIATSTTSPPGHYFLNYTQSYAFYWVLSFDLGVLDLTITPNPNLAVACFYAQAEIIQVGVPVTFNATCSTGPIVLYKWWFNYNNNPSSPPSTTTTGATAQTTYGSAGERTVRLVVVTAADAEAEVIHTYSVQAPVGPYADQVGP